MVVAVALFGVADIVPQICFRQAFRVRHVLRQAQQYKYSNAIICDNTLGHSEVQIILEDRTRVCGFIQKACSSANTAKKQSLHMLALNSLLMIRRNILH